MQTLAVEVVDNSTATIDMDIIDDFDEIDDFEEPDESCEFYDELEEEPL